MTFIGPKRVPWSVEVVPKWMACQESSINQDSPEKSEMCHPALVGNLLCSIPGVKRRQSQYTEGRERLKKRPATPASYVVGLTSKGSHIRGLSCHKKGKSPHPPARIRKFIERP